MAIFVPHPTHIVEVLVLLPVCMTLIKVVYRLFFHPFKSVPGPFLNKISAIPSSWALLRGLQAAYHHELHEKYGHVVRLGPDELIYSSPEAWEQIYGFKTGHVNGNVMDKSPSYTGISAPTSGQVGLGAAVGKEHTRQRRLMAAGFTKSSLYSQHHILQNHIQKLVTILQKACDTRKAVNVSELMSFTSFDIIGDMVFAEPFGCLDQGSENEWALSNVQLLVAITWSIAFRRVVGNNARLMNLFTKFLPAEAAKWKILHFTKTRDKTLRRLKAEKPDHKDIMYHIQRSADNGDALTPQQLVLNMALLIIAGSETTATSLTACIFCLCTNANAYQRLTAEIRSAFKNTEEITGKSLQDLPYLEGTWREALRLFPAGSTNQQRVVPAGGAEIGGVSIPGGMFVSVSPWTASRSSRNFYEPELFAPERWLQDKPSVYANDRLNASQPFSLGPKGCLGKDMADFEAKMLLANLFLNFDMTLETGGEHGQQNKLWSLDSYSTSIKTFQALMKPALWVRFEKIGGSMD